jgi:hypothetical protein
MKKIMPYWGELIPPNEKIMPYWGELIPPNEKDHAILGGTYSSPMKRSPFTMQLPKFLKSLHHRL